MPHDTPLIATCAAAFVFALALGFAAAKVRLPPLVGYLLAGVLIGPFTPGFVADVDLAGQLAEIGVILLMFGVGLHFSVKDLLAVRGIAIPGAIAQILTATLIGGAMARFWGWSLGASFVFGLSLSVASTVVLLKALEQKNAVTSPEGRIAVGWLIVEDLAMVFALVLLPAFAAVMGGRPGVSADGVWLGLGWTLTKVALFVAAALIVGTRVVPWMLAHVARTGSRELFTLAVLAVALGIAIGSAILFDVSFALGAFFAGVILSESDLSHKAAEDSLPLQDAFAVLFFVSVGMLFDPTILVRQPWAVLGVLLVIVVGKSIAAFVIVLGFRYPVETALTVSASLAQIGEFSFILANLGLGLGLLPAQARDLILAGSILSIALNPIVFASIPLLLRALRSNSLLMRWLERGNGPGLVLPSASVPPLQGHAVVVGHGRVGGAITPLLEREGLPFVVIERDRHSYESLRKRGVPAVYGDASASGVLQLAGIVGARMLIIASPDGYQARRILELSRAANSRIETLVRTHSYEELQYLKGQQVGFALMAERELARRLAEHVLRSFGIPPTRARLLVEEESAAELAQKAEGR
jgi:CPA2 family monovalent cation:H+ antiporter-2